MVPIITLIMVLVLSLLITRIATIALVHTGMSQESARFQARSAFSGVGYTTGESEKVVNHPVRRKILYWLMLLGNIGFVTALSSVLLGFLSTGKYDTTTNKIIILIPGLLFFWFLTSSKIVDRQLSILIHKALKRYTDLDIRDYVSLFHLSEDYKIAEILVEPEDWTAGKVLMEMRLNDEGILVLGIQRHDGQYLGAPKGHTKILANDTLIAYGRKDLLDAIDKRKSGHFGDKEHIDAIKEQKKILADQKIKEKESIEDEPEK